MTEKSLLPRAAQAEGISFASLVEKIVKAALRRKEERKSKMKR